MQIYEFPPAISKIFLSRRYFPPKNALLYYLSVKLHLLVFHHRQHAINLFVILNGVRMCLAVRNSHGYAIDVLVHMIRDEIKDRF